MTTDKKGRVLDAKGETMIHEEDKIEESGGFSEYTLAKGTVVKFRNIPVELSADTKVRCRTDLTRIPILGFSDGEEHAAGNSLN